jgi:hypothetical protein
MFTVLYDITLCSSVESATTLQEYILPQCYYTLKMETAKSTRKIYT